jgi:predicted nucleotidyltransferase
MTSVKGLENKTFEQLLEKAYIAEINDIPVYFIDYENLIIAKKAANRPKDILDIEELEKLNKKYKLEL